MRDKRQHSVTLAPSHAKSSNWTRPSNTPLPQPAMNRQSRLSASPFKAGLEVEIVRGRAFFRCRKLREERVMIEQRFDDLEVIGHVGPYMQQAAGLQDASDSIGEEVSKNSASAMLSFPPRIGKVDVNRRQRRGLDQMIE